jgi:hypothetical protein
MNELFNEVDGGEDEEMNEIIWYYVQKERKREREEEGKNN